MTWSEETDDYARERLHALAMAVVRGVQNYVNFASRLQAEAIYETMEILWDALEGAEEHRRAEEAETNN